MLNSQLSSTCASALGTQFIGRCCTQLCARSARNGSGSGAKIVTEIIHSGGTAKAKSFSTAATAAVLPKLKRSSLFHANEAFINNEWVSYAHNANVKSHHVYNPSTGDMIGTIPILAANEIDAAIENTVDFQKQWVRSGIQERSNVLLKWNELILQNIDDIAAICTAENGKPLNESIGEIRYAASFLPVFAGEAMRQYGTIIPSTTRSTHLSVISVPIGAVGAITPWNFPAAMITRKVGAAIAAGCTAILKPSEYTPFTAFALVDLLKEAGAPNGLLNIVTSNAGLFGEKIMANYGIRKVTFTGSTRVGKILMEQSAQTCKRLSLELGGNAPFIVFDDANLNKAVDGCIAAKFRNNGQTCVAANRIFVQRSIQQRFESALYDKVSKMIIGDGFHAKAVCGPLINKSSVEKVVSHVEDAKKQGAKVLVGGHIAEPSAKNVIPKKHMGLFFEPTIISEAHNNMIAFQEETFGPVATIYPFETEEEAFALANSTKVGLASYAYTESISRCNRLMHSLEYGMIALNQPSVSLANAPFGGIKESGYGREGGYLGLKDYLEHRTIHLNVD